MLKFISTFLLLMATLTGQTVPSFSSLTTGTDRLVVDSTTNVTYTMITSDVPAGTYTQLELFPYVEGNSGTIYNVLNLASLSIEYESTASPIGPYTMVSPTLVFSLPLPLPGFTQSMTLENTVSQFPFGEAGWVFNLQVPIVHPGGNIAFRFNVVGGLGTPGKLQTVITPGAGLSLTVLRRHVAATVNDINDQATIDYAEILGTPTTQFATQLLTPSTPGPNHTDIVNIGFPVAAYNLTYKSEQLGGATFVGTFRSDSTLGTYAIPIPLTTAHGFFIPYDPAFVGVTIGLQRLRINNSTGALEGAGATHFTSMPYIPTGGATATFWGNLPTTVPQTGPSTLAFKLH